MPPHADRSRSPRLHAAAPNEDRFDSVFGRYLVKQWSWGLKSAIEVQKEASLALTDQQSLLRGLKISGDFASMTLQGLAGIGTSGKHQGSCKRDLVSWLGDAPMPNAHIEVAPMKILKPRASDKDPFKKQGFPIMDPHEWFAWLYHQRRATFDQHFLDSDSSGQALVQFWKHVRKLKDPRVDGHAERMDKERDWNRLAIPASIHGDAVPCIQVGKPATKSFNIYSMSGLLGSGSTLEQKLALFGNFVDSEIETAEVSFGHAVWQRLLWSLYWCYLGKWPERDHIHNAPFPP